MSKEKVSMQAPSKVPMLAPSKVPMLGSMPSRRSVSNLLFAPRKMMRSGALNDDRVRSVLVRLPPFLSMHMRVGKCAVVTSSMSVAAGNSLEQELSHKRKALCSLFKVVADEQALARPLIRLLMSRNTALMFLCSCIEEEIAATCACCCVLLHAPAGGVMGVLTR